MDIIIIISTFISILIIFCINVIINNCITLYWEQSSKWISKYYFQISFYGVTLTKLTYYGNRMQCCLYDVYRSKEIMTLTQLKINSNIFIFIFYDFCGMVELSKNTVQRIIICWKLHWIINKFLRFESKIKKKFNFPITTL